MIATTVVMEATGHPTGTARAAATAGALPLRGTVGRAAAGPRPEVVPQAPHGKAPPDSTTRTPAEDSRAEAVPAARGTIGAVKLRAVAGPEAVLRAATATGLAEADPQVARTGQGPEEGALDARIALAIRLCRPRSMPRSSPSRFAAI